MTEFGVQDGNAEGQTMVDFTKRMEMSVKKTFFQKREEHKLVTSCSDVI